ncbi:MAG: DNA methyltransferase [Gammaproteobacteria bacterium]
MIKPGTIFTSDNLPILRGMDTECIDLIYLDPPFNSKRDYAAPVGSKAAGAHFKDTWTLSDTDDVWWGEIADAHPALYKVIDAAGAAGGKSDKAYCIYMAARLLEMRRVLKPAGSIYYHCDPTMSHAVKMILDAIFGAKTFRNEITWKRYRGKRSAKKPLKFPAITDSILFYSKGGHANFHLPFSPLNEEYIKRVYRHNDNDGRGAYRYGGRISDRKYYLANSRGIPATSLWDDVPELNGKVAEHLGYPTQKPLALLKRIIAASSREGDIVLDPFCGCATACVAAQYERRQWIGIDISPKAYDLTVLRFEKELDIFNPKIIHRMDVPIRSDQQRRSKNIKHILFGRQQGICNGCLHDFQFQNFQQDHIIPRHHGGADSDENLQLLCGYCNSRKGTGTMEELIAGLERDGLRKQRPGARKTRKKRKK